MTKKEYLKAVGEFRATLKGSQFEMLDKIEEYRAEVAEDNAQLLAAALAKARGKCK